MGISTKLSTHQLERTQSNPINWRDRFAVEGRADLWRLMQHVDPRDTEIQDLIKLKSRVSTDSVDSASLTQMIEFKRLCLQSGIDPSKLIEMMTGLNALLPPEEKLQEGMDPVGALLGLPLGSMAKAAWIGAFFTKFSSAKGSEKSKTCEEVMENIQMFERAMVIVSILHSGYNIVRGSKEIARMKAALVEAAPEQRAALQAKEKNLEAKLHGAIESKENAGIDLAFFETFHELMMVRAQLEPEKYKAFKALLEAQINDIEKSTQATKAQLKETVKAAAFDVTDVVLEIIDPSGLIKSGMGLVIKTQGLYEKIVSAQKAIKEVKTSIRSHGAAQLELNALIDETTKTEFEPEHGNNHTKLLKTTAKVNRCFWESKKDKHVESVSLKTLGVAGGLLGLAGLVCKILVIVGIAAGTTALMASSFGLAGVIILALIIAFKAGIYAYKHRSEIACKLEVFKLQIASFFTTLINKANHGKWSSDVASYSQRIQAAKYELELTRLSNKVGHIGIKRIKKLADRHFKLISTQAAKVTAEEGLGKDKLSSTELSTRVFKAITGAAPKYTFTEAQSVTDLQNRFVASVVHEMMT